MTHIFWEELKEELLHGTMIKGHPFRYCTLGTVEADKIARLRTVVLRKVSKDLKLYIYTDKRSKKISHLNENPKTSMLFYHPQKLVQVKVEGSAQIISDPSILKKSWDDVQPNHRKDYTTYLAPGSSIKNPDHLEYLDNQNHFCILEVIPATIEYLKLKHPNHIRVKFSQMENGWKSEFLVP